MTRDRVASFLWPETEAARNCLRYALWTVRKELGPEWLIADEETLSLDAEADIEVDVQRFRTLLGQAALGTRPVNGVMHEQMIRLEEAVALYRGDFLSSFTLTQCPDFDEWQSLHTETYRQDLALALEALVVGLCYEKQYEHALPHARRWVALDPLHEPAHRSLMRLHAETGHRALAIHQYEACAQYLMEELGIGPGARTVDLYQDIVARRYPVDG